MMRLLISLVGAALAATAGCAAPTIPVRHALPADAPVGSKGGLEAPMELDGWLCVAGLDGRPAREIQVNLTQLRLDFSGTTRRQTHVSGTILGTPGSATTAPAVVGEWLFAGILAELAPASEFTIRGRMDFSLTDPAGGGKTDLPLEIVELTAKDEKGTRGLRAIDAAGQTRARSVPTLRRTCRMHLAFLVAPAGGGESVRIETKASYDSAEDPRIRGESGLERGDDPERVPPLTQILAELFRACVEDFRGMVTPYEVTGIVRMRPTLNAAANRAAEAAGKGDYAAAVAELRQAVSAEPLNADLLFNLAVAEEARGDVTAAHEHYAQSLAIKPVKDADALAARTRTERLARRAAGPTTQP